VRIFLVRHGETTGNVDKAIYRDVADHAVPLTERGREQARAAGRFLHTHFTKLNLFQGLEHRSTPIPGTHPRMWVSPYRRARETADEIEAALRLPEGDVWGSLLRDRREHLLLAEQQFGALDGVAGQNVKEHFPAMAEAYDRAKRDRGRIFARPWGGESRFDVCLRVHQAFGTFHRDAERHGIQDLIIVAHGTTIRAFVMMWLHLPYEWFEDEKNPPNGSIRLIEDKTDRGYIHGGPG
jgi:broad specificity phosphatase PhoE